MENKDLSELLAQLHEEIKNTQAIDDKEREILRDLEGDISALLKHSEEHPEPADAFNVDNLENSLTHFEVSHPSLTVLISKLLETLSNSGI